jgi:hypothetical protein
MKEQKVKTMGGAYMLRQATFAERLVLGSSPFGSMLTHL